MTPRTEAPGLFVHAGLPRQFRDQVRWNQMGDLPQDGKRTAARGGGFVHPRRVAGQGFHAKPIFTTRENMVARPFHHRYGMGVKLFLSLLLTV